MFTYEKTIDGAYGVKGHPNHPNFTFASVRRINQPGRRGWEVVNVYVKDAKVPSDTYARREVAAMNALEADLAARRRSSLALTRDRNVPLAVINSMIMGRGVAYVLDIEQIGDDHFQVTYTREDRRTGGDRQDTIIVDRKGDMIGRPGTIVHTVAGVRNLRNALERGLGFAVAS